MATTVGKRYDNAAAKREPEKQYVLEDAVNIIKEMPAAKFDESVDISFRLGVDPKHAEQMVRGAVVLPHGIGKVVRVAVFAKGEKEREAREAGADTVGAEDLVEKVQGGMDGVRHRHRHAGSHGPGRPPRQGARAARPDAEPEARYRHVRRQQSRP